MAERSQRPVWLGEDKRQWDHVRVHIQLIHDPRLNADCMAVYLGLARHAEIGSGDARPSQETLAGYVGRSWNTVHKAIQTLESYGYVEVESRAGFAHLYRLLPPPEVADGVIPRPAAGGALARLASAPDARPPHQNEVGTPSPGANEQERTKNKNKTAPTGSAVPPGQPADAMSRTQQAQRAIMEENMARMAAEEPPPPPEDRRRMAAEVHEANRQKLGR